MLWLFHIFCSDAPIACPLFILVRNSVVHSPSSSTCSSCSFWMRMRHAMPSLAITLVSRRWWIGCCIYSWLDLGDPPAPVVLPSKWPTEWRHQPSKGSWLFTLKFVAHVEICRGSPSSPSLLLCWTNAYRTLRHQDISAPRQYGTSKKWCRIVSRQFSTRFLLVPNCPDTSAPVPKYLETLWHHPSKIHMIWAIVSSE